MSGWEVAGIEPITMHRSNRLADMYVLSPFVWREGGMFHLLTRAVPRRDDDPRLKMAEIWHGTSEDGLHFEMESAPTLFPGPDLVDLDGCEDPTVRVDKGTMRVWYTGYNEQQKTGRLLLARGPAVAKLAKAGIAIDSSPDFTNPKESTVAAVGSSDWRMYFEYAANGASLIGQASADNLDGPWENVAQSPITPRVGGNGFMGGQSRPFATAVTRRPRRADQLRLLLKSVSKGCGRCRVHMGTVGPVFGYAAWTFKLPLGLPRTIAAFRSVQHCCSLISNR